MIKFEENTEPLEPVLYWDETRQMLGIFPQHMTWQVKLRALYYSVIVLIFGKP
jgi:hypothetical protein